MAVPKEQTAGGEAVVDQGTEVKAMPIEETKLESKSDPQLSSSPDTAGDEEAGHGPAPIPWSYKWIALVCVMTFPLGSNWTQSALSPLKNTLRTEMGINNAQFGVISSADAFVNTVWPILGGLMLDWCGPNSILVCCTGVIFVGSLIAAISTNLGLWRMLVGGHVLMGFGTAVLDSAQQKFFYHWFGAAGFAFPFGLENSVASSTGLISGNTAIPIRDHTGWYGWTFWIPCFLCAFSLGMSIFYVIYERTVVPEKFRLRSARHDEKHLATGRGKTFLKTQWNILFLIPWAYLMLPATQVLQSGAADGFGVNSADIIRMRGYSEATAGFISTGRKILPILLCPFVGLGVDYYGHRFHLVALAPLMWIISCALLGWATTVHPLVALVFASLAGPINAMPLQICIPLLVADQDKLGTAFGLWRAFNNSGSTIMDVVFGVLQDNTDGGGYSKVLLLAIGLKAWAFFLGLAYIVIDHRYLGKCITMTRKQREAREAAVVDPATDPLTKREAKSWCTWTTLGLLLAMIVTAWTVFLLSLFN